MGQYASIPTVYTAVFPAPPLLATESRSPKRIDSGQETPCSSLPSSRPHSQLIARPVSIHTWLPKAQYVEMASNCDGLLLTCLSPTLPHVQLVVGQHVADDHEVLRIRVPSAVLVDCSAHLGRRIESAATTSEEDVHLNLDFIDPALFEIFLHFACFGKLRARDRRFSRRTKILWRSLYPEEAIQVWQLGQELIARTLQDACVDQLVETYRVHESMRFDLMEKVFATENVGEGKSEAATGLRKLFRACCVKISSR